MITFQKEKLCVEIYPTRAEMGKQAAKDIQDKIVELLRTQDSVSIIFAAAPSQNEVLDALTASKQIDWTKVRAFHMDEYIGLPKNAPQAFGNFLRERLFDKVPFGRVQYINASASDPEKEAERYQALLAQEKMDIVVLGIGENGHIAFNDPPVADFHDTKLVKTVQLDEICRQQQVNDGCFASINEVPMYAITLTVPMLISAKWAFCIVPAKSKATAVKNTLFSTVSERCPATILRQKEHAKLYLDTDSAEKIINEIQT